MKGNNLVKCSKLSVNCISNDSVSKRLGGPAYLGFGFNVRNDQVKEMKDFIEETIKKCGLPLKNIRVSGEIEVNENEISTKDNILSSIENDKDYLLSISKRKYSFSCKL